VPELTQLNELMLLNHACVCIKRLSLSLDPSLLVSSRTSGFGWEGVAALRHSQVLIASYTTSIAAMSECVNMGYRS
jgi:hypothetical protein